MSADRSARATTSVLIVDDHRAFADLLALALDVEADFTVVGTATDADTAVSLAARTRPGLIIMDIQLGGPDGLAATRRIRALLPDAVVVVISAQCDPNLIAGAATAGASAFAPKSGSLAELLSVLRCARSGSMLVAPSLLRRPSDCAAQRRRPTAELATLTLREHDVLGLMGRGVAPAQIARVLNISVHTCRSYVKTIHGKLGVRSQLEAVVKAQRLGLIAVGENVRA